jgi:hypothetical protein
MLLNTLSTSTSHENGHFSLWMAAAPLTSLKKKAKKKAEIPNGPCRKSTR